MKFYRRVSLIMTFVFVIVGLIFLLIPAQVLDFFNTLAAFLHMEQSPVFGHNFYLILAVGYMYLVSLLAFQMFRHPENKFFPFLLAQGKFASSILSFVFFFLHRPFLIYFTNGVVDGIIGIIVLSFYLSIRKQRA